MEQNNNQAPTPDLATVLANLARFAPAGTQQSQQASVHNDTTGVPSIHLPYNPYTPSSQDGPPQTQFNLPLPGNAGRGNAPTPQARQSIEVAHRGSPAPPVIDPATIVDWRSGLRCVSKIAVQNPAFKGTIQRMIGEQDSHVRLWERGRNQLIEEHAAKRTGTQSLSHTVSSLTVNRENPSEALEKDEAELKAYDQKVYKASTEMFEAQSVELKRLGVPFFGTKSELIVQPNGGGSLTQASGKITSRELLSLQKRMVGHLEDLYRE